MTEIRNGLFSSSCNRMQKPPVSENPPCASMAPVRRIKTLSNLLNIRPHHHRLHRVRRHLHDRPLKLFPSPYDIVHNCSDKHKRRHDHAVIHGLGRDRRRDGEETEDENDDPKANRDNIDHDSEDAGKMEGTPYEGAGLSRVVNAVPGADPAGAAAVEEEALGDDVGCIEVSDTEGNDVVEGGRGSDVDQSNDTGGEGGDEDCIDRYGTASLDLCASWLTRSIKEHVGQRRPLTLLTWRQNGMPRSRANAQIRRDAVARAAMVPHTVMTISIQIMAVAPPLLPVAS